MGPAVIVLAAPAGDVDAHDASSNVPRRPCVWILDELWIFFRIDLDPLMYVAIDETRISGSGIHEHELGPRVHIT